MSSPSAWAGSDRSTQALRPTSVALRRPERSGRRRIVFSAAALLLVAAVGSAAVLGTVAPQRQLPSGAALAVAAPNEAVANGAAPNGAAPNDVATASPEPRSPVPLRVVSSVRSDGDTATHDGDTADDGDSDIAIDDGDTATHDGDTADDDDGDTATHDGDTPEPGAPRVMGPADAPARRGATVTRSGWLCDGSVRLEDPRGRRWSLGGAAFRTGPGYERVVLHIDRLGPGSGAAASVTAQALSTARVHGTLPGVRTPSSGQTTFSLHLTGPIEGNLGVRGHRPNGLRLLKEFSVYPAAAGSSRVLVSAAAGECFRVRVPAWRATGPNTRTAQIYLDIKS